MLVLAAALGAAGCGSGNASTVTITMTPTIASVITNRTQLFTGVVSGSSNTAITWTLACAVGVTANTCGAIDGNGLYTAPAILPTITTNGIAAIAPTVTITATAQADTSKYAMATLTIVTGISIVITPPTATVGTGERFVYAATVNNPGCNITTNPTCQNVTWSLPTTPPTSGSYGTIGATTGVYTAPTTAQGLPVPGTVIITATSVADTSVTATATVTVVTAVPPTVTSVSPNTAALGGLFQDVYITGTNFISTNNVFIINGPQQLQLSPAFVTQVSSSLIRARIPDYILASPPSNIFQIGVSEQSGSAVTCVGDLTPCEVTVMGVRPGVVGPTPDTIPQNTAGVLTFNVDGGFFGTGGNPAAPAVSATYNGQIRGIQLPASQTLNSTRQLSVSIGGGSNSSDFTTPGLYPVAVISNADPTRFAVTNLAVQPTYAAPTVMKRIPVGSAASSAPSDVAINPATGMAVVANNGSNDISLIDLKGATPSFIANICTAAIGAAPPCPASGPTSVSIYSSCINSSNINICNNGPGINEAVVVNSTSKTIAVVDLDTQSVASVISLPPGASGIADTPMAVGINPVTGLALVAMQRQSYGALMDLTVNPPAFTGIVSITTGSNPHIAVEPHLNWALSTPGGNGSLGIVDLSRQSSYAITNISRTTNVVTVTVQTTASAPALSVMVNDTVLIQNIQLTTSDTSISGLAPTFDGFYTVTSVGPGSNQFSYSQTGATLTDVATQSSPLAASGTVYYSQSVANVGLPVGVQGIGINPETQQAVLVDPTNGGAVSFFSLIDQSVSSLTLKTNNSTEVGTIAAAYNPLTNTVVAVNFINSTLSVIDPTAPRRLNDGNLYSTLPGPVAIAIDPGTNMAVIANQTDNSVSVLNLGAIKPFSITETSPKTIVTNSTLGAGPSPAPQLLTVIGKGLTCVNGSTNLSVRLDGVALPTSCPASGDRQLTATVPFSMLTSARRFALDVADSSGNLTNAEDLTVEQSVDVSSTSCPTPKPMGVSIDPQQNLAAVTLFGCNALALVNLSTGTGNTVVVGTNPVGVATLPRLHYAVVANNVGTASIVDEVQQSVKQTVTTGSGSMGAAADQTTGEVAIANNLANTVSLVNAITGGVSNISTGQGPVAVAFNYVNHQVAVAAMGGNSLAVTNGVSGTQNGTFSVNAPTSVIYDPVPTDCGSNHNGTTTNTAGCFIVSSETGNSVNVIDPTASIQTGFRVGLNPTSIAYNYLTSTLVSSNTLSHTVTVADFLGQKIRAVMSLPPIAPANAGLALILNISGTPQYGLDIHPFTNIAVIADTPNGRVLFVPLPR
jgi:DNA-binding beta-propeller fold protein YncE